MIKGVKVGVARYAFFWEGDASLSRFSYSMKSHNVHQSFSIETDEIRWRSDEAGENPWRGEDGEEDGHETIWSLGRRTSRRFRRQAGRGSV